MNGTSYLSTNYSNHLAKCIDIEFIDDQPSDNLIVKTKLSNKWSINVDDNHPLKQELSKVRALLRFFRCAFYPGLPKYTLFINYTLWISAFLFHSIAVIFTLYFSITSKIDNKSLIFLMVRCFTSLLSLLTMIFTLYWQKKCHFKSYVHSLHDVQESFGCKKYQKNISTLIRYLYINIFIVISFCVMISSFQIFEIQIDFLNRDMVNLIRRNRFMIIPQFVFSVYSSVCTSAAMFLYCIFTYGAVLEVRYFNERIDNIGKTNKETIIEDLMRLIIDHAKISEAIRNLDSMCEVFAFLMIGCTIPITVFTTLQLLSTKGLPLVNLVISFPMFFFCIILLTGLTAIPSKAYTVLDQSKHHLYSNTVIWKSFDKKVFQIANSLAAHLNQPDLGVTLWGFALISKPLILTTISVMVTCMAFLLELRKKPTI